MARKRKRTHRAATLRFGNNDLARELFGSEDANLKLLEKGIGVEIDARGGNVVIRGTDADISLAENVLGQMYNLLKKGYPIIPSDIERAIGLISKDGKADIESLYNGSIIIPSRRGFIIPRTPSQKAYLEEMRENDIVFAIGPAGTGKSYLAVAMAVASLLKKEFDRVVLARPAVEAGEKLGFLPGDMQEKVNPYLRPLYDALYDMLGVDRVAELIAEDVIEIAPLAFMRGRTLSRCFVILDEAQNCSYHQMKMCLTRLGVDSKMVVNGDVTQIDLPAGSRSGLLEAWRILAGCDGVAFHQFTDVDIVRHPLVSMIVQAYQCDEDNHA